MAQTFEQVMTPESLQIVAEVFEEELKLEVSGTADPGRVRILELEQYRKDGSTVWLESHLSSFRDKENKIAGIITLSHDITDRKRAEEMLKESEKKYRLLADNVNDVIFVLDINLNYTYVSPSVKTLMGYESEELLNLRASETMTPSSWDMAVRILSEVMALEKSGQRENKKPQMFQLEMKRKDGSTVWTEVKTSFIRDENQRPVGLIGVSRDITERKRAGEALLESEEQYRLVVENARESIIVTQDVDVKVVFANHAAIDAIGYSKEILSSKYFTDLIHPDDLNMVVDRHIKRLKGEEVPPVYSFRVIRQNGTVMWCEINAALIQWKGKPATLLFLNNITERKQAEEELKESESKYRLLADNVNDVIFILDMNLKFTYVSPSTKILRGYEPEESVKLSVTETLAPSSMELAMKTISDIMELEKMKKIEINESRTIPLEVMRKDGSTVWTEVKFSFIRDKDQQPVGILGVTRDITERRRAEDELRESESKYRLLADNIDDVLFVLDMNLNYTYASPAVKTLMGYEPEELLNLRASETMTSSSWDMSMRTLSEFVEMEKSGQRENKKPQMFQLEMKRKDGSTVWTEVKVSFIRDENQRSLGLIGVSRDITERKRTEEAQQKSEEQFRLLAENARDTIWAMDMNLQYTYMSPYVKQTLDYTPEEYILMPLNEIMTPASLELCMQVFTEEMEIEKRRKRDPLWSRTIEIEHIHRSGKIVPVEIKLTFIRNAAGQATGFLGYTRDITERKLAAAKLQQTLDNLKKAVDTTIHVMVSVIEARDPYTAGHQLRVADLARAIATEMGLDQEEIDGIQLAGSIHDIGKLSVPAEILSKPTKLTKIEYSMIKEHPQSGYEILKDVESPWPLAQVAYQHHERMDGSGYPRNLKGDEILMEARIMAVADVVEAMSSHRPYRPSLGIDAALEEIEKNKGILYDDAVAAACLRLFRENGYKLLAQK
jgi:PAS domain S-box-containing protein